MVVAEIYNDKYYKKYNKPITFYIEPWIKDRFDRIVIPDLKKRDKDCVIAIDGREGSGKSTLGLQWCMYIDPTFNLDRVVFTPEEFREAIYKAKKGQAVMFDEAFTGFSSRSSLSGVNKVLTSLMMQIRQKNLFVVIVLPTFFLLDKYISIFRTRVLVHVYETKKSGRGYFRVFSAKKKRLLILHKESRTYSYGIKTKLRGKFTGVFALGDEEEEKKYRKKKMKALEEAKQNPMEASTIKYRNQRNFLMWILMKELKKREKMSYRKLETLLGDYGFEISFRQIATICSQFGGLEDIDYERKGLDKENKEKEQKNSQNQSKESENHKN